MTKFPDYLKFQDRSNRLIKKISNWKKMLEVLLNLLVKEAEAKFLQ